MQSKKEMITIEKIPSINLSEKDKTFNEIRKKDCLDGKAIGSLQSEVDCLKELGVDSFELEIIIDLKSKEVLR